MTDPPFFWKPTAMQVASSAVRRLTSIGYQKKWRLHGVSKRLDRSWLIASDTFRASGATKRWQSPTEMRIIEDESN
jgi:hypothetical protein